MRREDAIIVHYNSPGHPREFTLNLPGYGHNTEYIPVHVERGLAVALGENYHVDNRGSRLEITSSLFTGAGDDHVDTVVHALKRAVEVTYDQLPEIVVELFPYEPPEPTLRHCNCCGEMLPLRTHLEHLRAARLAATA